MGSTVITSRFDPASPGVIGNITPNTGSFLILNVADTSNIPGIRGIISTNAGFSLSGNLVDTWASNYRISRWTESGLIITGYLGFQSTDLGISSNPDTFLYRDNVANALGIRNGNNPQFFRVYSNYVASNNFVRLNLNSSSTDFTIAPESRGFNDVPLNIYGGANTLLNLGLGNSNYWRVSTTGFSPTLDNTYDIGLTGNRVRNVWATQIVNANAFQFNSFGSMYSSVDGVIVLANNAATDFNRLVFGGASASYPSLRRSGVALHARLGDDSANTTFAANDLILSKTITNLGVTGSPRIINTACGSINFQAGSSTSVTVTNSLVTSGSVVVCTVASNDSTLKSVAVVQSAGSFRVYPNAAATAEARVNFLVVN